MTSSSSPLSSKELRRMLDCCRPGIADWRKFEAAGLATLRHVFVPPLLEPHIQNRTLSGIDRRDAVFEDFHMQYE